MRHSISLTCVRYRLRPVTLEDAPFIVELRTDPLLNRYLHEISSRVEDQVAWIERYFERPEDYYFIIEDSDSEEPHGAIGIYDVEENAAGAQWGRWILKHGRWRLSRAPGSFARLAFPNLDSRACRRGRWWIIQR